MRHANKFYLVNTQCKKEMGSDELVVMSVRTCVAFDREQQSSSFWTMGRAISSLSCAYVLIK